MSDNLGTFGETAKSLSRNPLGIIALFIVLVYGMAALALGVANGLNWLDRLLLVLFLVLFPPIVLMVFKELVISHHTKLYGPGDFKDEKIFGQLIRQVTQVAESTNAAIASGTRTGLPAAAPSDPARVLTTALRATAVARSAPRVPKVLWVDDRPDNNVHERAALEAAGFSVHMATTTEEAEKRVAAERFDVIISDMARPEGAQAGYDLLKQLRDAKNETPYIIYASSAAPEQRSEAQRRGALDCTNDPNELLELVTRAIPG